MTGYVRGGFIFYHKKEKRKERESRVSYIVFCGIPQKQSYGLLSHFLIWRCHQIPVHCKMQDLNIIAMWLVRPHWMAAMHSLPILELIGSCEWYTEDHTFPSAHI